MRAVLFSLFLMGISSLYGSFSLQSMGGTTLTVPNQNQLIFIGSSKKACQQIEGWFQALKSHPEITKRYQIVVVPLVEGLFSSFLFRKGFIVFLSTLVPERHRKIVAPVFKGDVEFPFFSSLRKTSPDELQVILFNQAKEPVWQVNGAVSEEIITILKQF